MMLTPNPATYSTIYTPPTWLPALCADIAAAKRAITLTSLRLDTPHGAAPSQISDLWAVLTDRAAAGLQVTVCLPSPAADSAATARNVSTARALHSHGIRCALLPRPGLLHAKSALLDDGLAWLGSANLTFAAARWNLELMLRTTDPPIVAQLASWLRAMRASPPPAAPT